MFELQFQDSWVAQERTVGSAVLNVFFGYAHQWLSSSILEGILVCLIRLFETIDVRI